MKTREVVKIFLHLEDSKGWKQIVEWTISRNLPHKYFIAKRPSFKEIAFPMDLEKCPPLPDRIEFSLHKEEPEILTDKFFNLHGYYKED